MVTDVRFATAPGAAAWRYRQAAAMAPGEHAQFRGHREGQARVLPIMPEALRRRKSAA